MIRTIWMSHPLCYYISIIAGPSGFEPESEAPEAPMLSKLYYRPMRVVVLEKVFAGARYAPAILKASDW